MVNKANAGKRRNNKGQALIESTVGLCLLTGAFVLMVSFGVNAYTVYQNNAALRSVALETAKVIQSRRYWLGRPRPDYGDVSEETRRQQFIDVANTLCERVKIPHISSDDFKYAIEPGESVDYITVYLTLRDVQLPFAGGAFPSVIATSAYGAAAQPHDDPYAVMNIDAFLPGSTSTKLGVQIPVYGYFTGYGSNPVALNQNNPSSYASTSSGLPNGFAPLCGGKAKYIAGLPMVPPTQFAGAQVTNNSVTGFNH